MTLVTNLNETRARLADALSYGDTVELTIRGRRDPLRGRVLELQTTTDGPGHVLLDRERGVRLDEVTAIEVIG